MNKLNKALIIVGLIMVATLVAIIVSHPTSITITETKLETLSNVIP